MLSTPLFIRAMKKIFIFTAKEKDTREKHHISFIEINYFLLHSRNLKIKIIDKKYFIEK